VGVDLAVVYGHPLEDRAATLRWKLATALARQTELNITAIDVTITDVLKPRKPEPLNPEPQHPEQPVTFIESPKAGDMVAGPGMTFLPCH
jgi:uncharacterized alkaline shock family protein YloU